MHAGIALAGTAAHLWQAAAAYAFGSLANGMEVVATRSFLNHRAPGQVAGRVVFAVYSGVLFGAASAGMAAAGGLLSSLNPRVVLILARWGRDGRRSRGLAHVRAPPPPWPALRSSASQPAAAAAGVTVPRHQQHRRAPAAPPAATTTATRDGVSPRVSRA